MTIESPDRAAPDVSSSQRSPTAAWLPWTVVGVLATVIILTLVLTDNTATATKPSYPHHQLDDPRAPWIFTYVFPAVCAAMLILFTAQTIRNRVIAMPAMLFVAGTTMFWIEWPADWGSYLVYNKDFWAFAGWTSTWYQTYWKPVGVIFGYGIFFAVECIILLKVVPRVSAGLQRILPRISPTAALLLACATVFYLVDILGERLMTWLGWYSYVDAVGWLWTSDRGTISFVWPAIPFLLFAAAISLLLRADHEGNYPNEKWFKVHTLAPGWAREFARLAVWIVTMNVAIFVAQPLILVIGRILFLHDSIYVP
jgi:hypothetical protein